MRQLQETVSRAATSVLDDHKSEAKTKNEPDLPGDPRPYSIPPHCNHQSPFDLAPTQKKKKKKRRKIRFGKRAVNSTAAALGMHASPYSRLSQANLHYVCISIAHSPLFCLSFSSPDRKLRRVPPRVAPSERASQHSNCNWLRREGFFCREIEAK